MHILGKIKVTSVLPEELSGLKEMAYNLWWSWNFEAIDLYREIDLPLWEKLGKNPVRFIQEVSLEKIGEKIADSEYMQQYRKIYERYKTYMKNENTWFSAKYPDMRNDAIAYFSAEYGLNEVLPVYSGGLGVLSGDHCKSASDLGLPFTAVGLFYKQGYFSQHINRDGWQETVFMDLNPSHLPLRPVLGDNGEQLSISVDFPDRIVHAKLWYVLIGRVKLYLMDTDTQLNSEHDRHLTSKLYGGDQETRIQQEILLGIGGLKTLDALNIKPSVFHMNEGHSAFLGLELLRKFIHENGLTFKEAREAASSQLVFTNHTPVPAGNDVFPMHMIDKYFNNYWSKLGISRHEFLDLGLKASDSNNFNMTVLAMALSGMRNGVSKLHGAVTRDMFKKLWPGTPENEIPISHVTNGIHTLTWLSPNFKLLYDSYLDSDWEEKLATPETWEKVDKIPDEELWSNHRALKEKMIRYLRIKLKEQRIENGESIDSIKKAEGMLDPNALTIGFARRFATYKRANLIFRDIERIKRIFGSEDRPVQIIFAGKAHPADGPAHDVIKSINDIASLEGFKGKVVLVENYNITLARNLVQGVDIWLNNPRRPLEASGTSGQKVCINGIMNFSISDGWWCEGFNGRNGWTIGSDANYENDSAQDDADSESMYDILENEIVPAYYERNENGVPEKWVSVMKESIKSVTHKFSTHRMVMEYTEKIYLPSVKRHMGLISDNFNEIRLLASWKEQLQKSWPHISIFAGSDEGYPPEMTAISGRPITVKTSVYLGSIEPSSVNVQVYYGVASNSSIKDAHVCDMKLEQQTDTGVYLYSAEISIPEGGEYAYTFRIIPHNPGLISDFDLKLIHWAVR